MTESNQCIETDEKRWHQYNRKCLQLQFPGKSEEEIKKIDRIDLVIIHLMYRDAFWAGNFHWYEQDKILLRVRKFQPNLMATDDEIVESLARCVFRKRLATNNFYNSYQKCWVTKYVFNKFYVQPPEESPEVIKPFSGISNESNPFDSPDFKKLQSELGL